MAMQRHLHGKNERSGTQPFMFHYRLFHYRLFSTLFDPHACAADGRQQNARARRAFLSNLIMHTLSYGFAWPARS